MFKETRSQKKVTVGDRVRCECLDSRGCEYIEIGVVCSEYMEGNHMVVRLDNDHRVVRKWSRNEVTYIESASIEELLTHTDTDLQFLGRFLCRKTEQTKG